MFDKNIFLDQCRVLLDAYKKGELWYMKMPEDEHPVFEDNQKELRLAYFTLPMALNYQRNSYTLRESALQTYLDPQTRDVFDVVCCATMDEEELRQKLMKYKVALQPNKHIATRKTIATTIAQQRGSIENMFEALDYDVLQLQSCIQGSHKKWFPYLSWPKIFHYRLLVMQSYGGLVLKNSDCIQIAPDTHVTKCSIKLGLITEQESVSLSKNMISARRREALQGSGINPIDMHSPLWFWSRNNFAYILGGYNQ